MSGFRVVMTDYNYDSNEIERKIVTQAGGELIECQCKSEDEVIAAVREADAVIPQYAEITRRVIEAMQRCRVIARPGIGVDIVDVEAATELGIFVTNVPNFCVEEVADQALLLLLAAARKLIPYAQAVRQGQWSWLTGRPVRRLSGKNLGLVGFGKIGRAIHRRAQGFGLRTLAYDPYFPADKMRELGALPIAFDDLLTESDFVIIQSPLTAETEHLFDERALRKMKPSAYLVNTARGPIVDDKALYRALREGWIAGAAVDDIEEEPSKVRNWQATNPLFSLPNFILTPHVAWYSEEALAEVKAVSAEEAVRVVTGQKPLYPVNSPKGVGPA